MGYEYIRIYTITDDIIRDNLDNDVIISISSYASSSSSSSIGSSSSSSTSHSSSSSSSYSYAKRGPAKRRKYHAFALEYFVDGIKAFLIKKVYNIVGRIKKPISVTSRLVGTKSKNSFIEKNTVGITKQSIDYEISVSGINSSQMQLDVTTSGIVKRKLEFSTFVNGIQKLHNKLYDIDGTLLLGYAEIDGTKLFNLNDEYITYGSKTFNAHCTMPVHGKRDIRKIITSLLQLE